jgi:hypothetical protein
MYFTVAECTLFCSRTHCIPPPASQQRTAEHPTTSSTAQVRLPLSHSRRAEETLCSCSNLNNYMYYNPAAHVLPGQNLDLMFKI